MSQSLTILGLDPGTATTGYGVIRLVGNQLQHIAHGCIITSPKLELPARLHQIAQELRVILGEHQLDAVGIEDLYFYNNVTTAIAVAQARGVMLQVCAEAGLPIRHYTPLQVKQAVTGHGQADKKQIQKMLQMILGLSSAPSPDDAADALAIAITCAHSHNLETIKS